MILRIQQYYCIVINAVLLRRKDYFLNEREGKNKNLTKTNLWMVVYVTMDTI